MGEIQNLTNFARKNRTRNSQLYEKVSLPMHSSNKCSYDVISDEEWTFNAIGQGCLVNARLHPERKT